MGHDNKYNVYTTFNKFDPLKRIFQWSKYVYFDINNYFLLICKKNDDVDIYDGSLNVDGKTPLVRIVQRTDYTYSSMFMSKLSKTFQVMFMIDEEGGNFISHSYIRTLFSVVIVIYTMKYI